ncbi:MAG: response regulator [Planctomycetota bacterium]|nr:response regulator [Planctomycetota bacterium]
MSAGKILVVDDEAHITHVLALKLRNAGFTVRTASDGEEAFELASQDPPDVLITDLQMPYMTGLELCIKLKKKPATAQIPALMLTARGHALGESDLQSTNIRMVLSKPFSPRHVLEEVERILGRGGAAGSGDGGGAGTEKEAA